VDAQQGNAERLPFADGTFDCVTCIGSIERFLDRGAALREMQRVAKPDARFCFLVRNASTFVWRVWRQWLGRRQVQGHQDARTLAQWRELFVAVWLRGATRAARPVAQGPLPAAAAVVASAARRKEPESGSLVPLRWCNELVFVLRRDRSRA
jgi:SAM-dependent methyltransferase